MHSPMHSQLFLFSSRTFLIISLHYETADTTPALNMLYSNHHRDTLQPTHGFNFLAERDQVHEYPVPRLTFHEGQL